MADAKMKNRIRKLLEITRDEAASDEEINNAMGIAAAYNSDKAFRQHQLRSKVYQWERVLLNTVLTICEGCSGGMIEVIMDERKREIEYDRTAGRKLV